MTLPTPTDAAHAAAIARVMRTEVERADMADPHRRRTLALVDLLLVTLGAEPAGSTDASSPAATPAFVGENVIPFRRAR